MKVLLIGSGGREHAIAWKLSQSKKLTKLYCAPGNPGTAQYGENVDIADTDVEALGSHSPKAPISAWPSSDRKTRWPPVPSMRLRPSASRHSAHRARPPSSKRTRHSPKRS
jgi:hypothetical protein